ncbi:MAG: tetratricopeptide repeat protein [Bryobacteraceae bacterium]
MTAVDHAFSTALFHHRAGNLPQAEAYCRRALRKQSEHAASLDLLGMIASEAGNQTLAAALIVRAIKSAGALPDYCVNLGLVLSRDGRLDAAASCYRQALQPDPGNWKTLLKLGLTVAALGRREEAIQIMETALALNGEAELHFELANQLYLTGDVERAIEHFRAAIRRRTAFPEAWFHLGVSLMRQNRPGDALAAYGQALHLRPRYPEALNNSGIVLQALGRHREAGGFYNQAIECKPDYFDARYNLGLVRQSEERHEEALDLYDAVVRLCPNHVEAHNNRGNVLLALGDPPAAVEAYGRVIALAPDHAQANWNLSLANLLLGRFEEGWKGWEWRLRRPEAECRSFSAPLWTGADVGNARILVHAEQGFGDTLQFVRYAAMVKERCGFVIMQCPPALVRTLRFVAGIDQVAARVEDLPDFDFHIPLLSLPAIFGTVEESIPRGVPYIFPLASLREIWRERIAPSADLKAGIVWAGNANHKNDANRSLPPEFLAPLLGLAGIQFYSLQKNLSLPGMLPLGLELTDFADTAAAIANLDLVISVDTAVAHLAGAMNKPVWTLLPFNPDWRWMLGRMDSPWYPSMRLFRQTAAKEWGSVIELVAGELATLVATRCGTRKQPGSAG